MVADLRRGTCKQASGSSKGTPAGQPIYVAQQGLDIITVARTGLVASPATGVERRVLVELRCLG
jgi:hypothetical protein